MSEEPQHCQSLPSTLTPTLLPGECWRSAKGCLGNDTIYVYGQIPGKTELLCYSFKPYAFLNEACTDPESSWDCVKVNISPGECLEGRIPIRELARSVAGQRASLTGLRLAGAGIWYD